MNGYAHVSIIAKAPPTQSPIITHNYDSDDVYLHTIQQGVLQTQTLNEDDDC
jgi:hypothetical protein